MTHPTPLELDHWTPGAHLLRAEFGVSRSSGDSYLEGTFHQEIYASCNALGRALWGSLKQYFSAVFTVFLIQNVIYRNRSRAEATWPLKKVFCTGNNSILLFFLALTRKLPVTLLPKLWKFESIEFPKFKLCIFLNVRIIRIYTNFKILFMPFSNIPVYVFCRQAKDISLGKLADWRSSHSSKWKNVFPAIMPLTIPVKVYLSCLPFKSSKLFCISLFLWLEQQQTLWFFTRCWAVII